MSATVATEQSQTAHVLNLVARILELWPDLEVNRGLAHEARAIASDAVLGNLPEGEREIADCRVMGAMPAADNRTCGTYAFMLRATASHIG